MTDITRAYCEECEWIGGSGELKPDPTDPIGQLCPKCGSSSTWWGTPEDDTTESSEAKMTNEGAETETTNEDWARVHRERPYVLARQHIDRLLAKSGHGDAEDTPETIMARELLRIERQRHITADYIVAGIIADLTDRSGLDGAWDQIDEATRKEIVQAWTSMALKFLNP